MVENVFPNGMLGLSVEPGRFESVAVSPKKNMTLYQPYLMSMHRSHIQKMVGGFNLLKKWLGVGIIIAVWG
jgi:hypothetical protein